MVFLALILDAVASRLLKALAIFCNSTSMALMRSSRFFHRVSAALAVGTECWLYFCHAHPKQPLAVGLLATERYLRIRFNSLRALTNFHLLVSVEILAISTLIFKIIWRKFFKE